MKYFCNPYRAKRIVQDLISNLFLVVIGISSGFAAECDKNIYLTFDTGNMAVAQDVARILREQNVKATFFLANEKTFRQDYALDESWRGYWHSLVKDGHHFGSHTYHHTYWLKDIGKDKVLVKSQFGPLAGKPVELTNRQFCEYLEQSDEQFKKLTGIPLDKIWRAPGGKTSQRLIEFGKVCGFQHVGWSSAGFLGDELPSEQYSNRFLLQKALQDLRNDHITMAHLGIWSRKDPWAPAVLEPLILGLKSKGFCFKRIGDLP